MINFLIGSCLGISLGYLLGVFSEYRAISDAARMNRRLELEGGKYTLMDEL